MRGKGRKAKEMHARDKLIEKRLAVVHELKWLLQNRVVTDRMRECDEERSLYALNRLQRALKDKCPEQIEICARESWDSALNDFAMGREAKGASIMEAIAESWLSLIEFNQPLLREIGLVSREIARYTVLRNAIDYLLEEHEDITHPLKMINVPDLSRGRDVSISLLWMEVTWRVMINHADVSDANVIRILGKESGCSHLSMQALGGIVSRSVAETGLEKGYARLYCEMPLEKQVARLEYFSALHVVGTDYPLKAWGMERRSAAEQFFLQKGLIQANGSQILTPAGRDLIRMLALAPKPF